MRAFHYTLFIKVWCLICLFFSTTPLVAADEMQVVVSIRYLKPQGRSYHHLYLYHEDGTLLRQLTNDSADDLEPRFSFTGDEIAFERWTPKGSTFHIMELKNESLKTIGKKPYWNQRGDDTDEFHWTMRSYESWPIEKDQPGARYCPSSDNTTDFILKIPEGPSATLDDYKGYLRDRKTGVVTDIALLPGFEGFGMPWVSNKSPFLIEPPLRVAFWSVHGGSTYGESHHAVDLNERKVVRLTENGGRIIALIGKPGFFCVNQERYQQLGDGRTVNCSCLDWWDSRLKRTRFSGSLGRFGGVSVLHNRKEFPLHISDFDGRNWLDER